MHNYMSAFDFLNYCNRVTRLALENPTSSNEKIAEQAWNTYLNLFPPVPVQEVRLVCSNRTNWDNHK